MNNTIKPDNGWQCIPQWFHPKLPPRSSASVPWYRYIDPLFLAITVVVGVPVALLFDSRIWGGVFGTTTGWAAAFIVTRWRERG